MVASALEQLHGDIDPLFRRWQQQQKDARCPIAVIGGNFPTKLA